jgi:hypothetical protein
MLMIEKERSFKRTLHLNAQPQSNTTKVSMHFKTSVPLSFATSFPQQLPTEDETSKWQHTSTDSRGSAITLESTLALSYQEITTIANVACSSVGLYFGVEF